MHWSSSTGVLQTECTTGECTGGLELEEGDTATVRVARRAALCGVANALVRQQGYTHGATRWRGSSSAVVEIHCNPRARSHVPDLAVGDVGGAGVSRGWGGCEW